MQSYLVGITGTELFAANGDPANQGSVDNLNETLKGDQLEWFLYGNKTEGIV